MGYRELDLGKVIPGEVVDGVTDDVVHVDRADLVDHSRVAYAEIHDDETAATAIGTPRPPRSDVAGSACY